MAFENGKNHWRIPKIISYYPDIGNKVPDFTIEKNVYGQAINGRPLRVIAQQMQIYEEKKFSEGAVSKDAFFDKPMRWIEIIDDIGKVKDYLRKWANAGYSREVI